MKLWMSAEIQADVGDSYRVLSHAIENEVNRLLDAIALSEKAETWALIAVIMKIERTDYDEVVKRSCRGKVLEFRLKIPYTVFLLANNESRIRLIFDLLQRSVELMVKLKVPDDTRNTLRNVLLDAQRSLR